MGMKAAGMSDDSKHIPHAALSLSEEAADWLLRLDEHPDDRTARIAFEQWLSRSEEHRKAWEKTLRVWTLLPHAQPSGCRASFEGHAPAPARRRFMRRGRLAAAAGGVAFCLLLLAAAPTAWIHATADYSTAVGEVATVTLADGSIVHLGGDTALRVRLHETQRSVAVLSGEAFFDVAHVENKPFVVEANGTEVEVVGTAFNVLLTNGRTEIALARGSIDASFERNGSDIRERLVPGQILVVDDESDDAAISAIAIDDIGSWREGRLHVANATIGSVVDQIRRYHPAWILLPDPVLSRQKVTGVYDLQDPDRALRALVAPYGGILREVTSFGRVISRL